jgi:hypothetical protein
MSSEEEGGGGNMRNVTVIILLTAVLTLSNGCSYWYQEGTSFADAEQASKDCLAQLEMRSEMRTFENYEINYMNDCLEAKGFKRRWPNELPTQARRELPELSKYWLLKGTAGDVDENAVATACNCR